MYDEQFWEWVARHRDDDPTRLRLKARGNIPREADAIAQIENERKAKRKFAVATADVGPLMPRLMPIAISVEQATSAKVALLHREIAASLLPPSPSILDMTCGLGVDASVLASIPGSTVTAIELNPDIAAVAMENYALRDNMEIVCGDSIAYLHSTSRRYDLIFIDPARRDVAGKRVYNVHDCTPDVTALMPLLHEKSDYVMVKLSPMLDVTQTIRDIDGITDLYIVEESGECRELLAVAGHCNTSEPRITAISGDKRFSFTREEELTATERFAMPSAGSYLLEPGAALMKAGAFKLVANRYDAPALHPNTHLYVAGAMPADFPGRITRIIDVLPFSSANIKQIKKQRLSAEVAVRNFPFTADSLRERLGIKKSGDLRIIGVTAMDNKLYLIIADVKRDI